MNVVKYGPKKILNSGSINPGSPEHQQKSLSDKIARNEACNIT
jgi:hypothetical protein